jgi:outer membrane immunogenic protein
LNNSEVKMRKMIVAAVASALIVVPVMAQDKDASASDATVLQDKPKAPDGTDAFGFEPYFAVMGGYASYDKDVTESGIPNRLDGESREGAVVEGLIGANIPLGAFFVGVEGAVAKGIGGSVDWLYGVTGRAGFRAGETGMIYGKAGFEWAKFKDDDVTNNRNYDEVVYGMGVEVGPRDIGLGGLTGNSGARIRLEVTTRNFETIRPMAGLLFHF